MTLSCYVVKEAQIKPHRARDVQSVAPNTNESLNLQGHDHYTAGKYCISREQGDLVYSKLKGM